MEHLLQLLKDYGAVGGTIVGGILAKLLHKAIKRFDKYSQTMVKADLAFEEVSTRVPEYAERFKTWQVHR